ncbi:MAG: hypothetical protein EAX96_06860 [Candidatus Lokiarchaeota archaeon]|nr:hypothetical protein [Candidatus Lokiarchaeota archaeon]
MIKTEVTKNINGIIVKIKNERYMIEVNHIKEIFIPGEKIIPIPLSDNSIVGVIDIRGIIYTILSLRHVVNSEESDYEFTKETRVLLLESEGINLGLLVDSVVGVTEVPLSIFDKKSSIIETSLDWEYIKSIGVLNDQSIILLDIGKLLSKPEIQEEPIEEKAEIEPKQTIKINPKISKPEPKKEVVKKESLPKVDVNPPASKIVSKISSSKFGKRSSSPKPVIRSTEAEKVLKITDAQKDMLKEVGNIGTGNAVTALSNLINRRVDVDFTDVNIIKNEDIISQFGGENEFVCGIFSHIEKPSQSTLLQIFEMNPLLKLVQTLEGMEKKKFEEVKKREDLDEFTVSTIKELGNILAGHYASALADLMGTKLVPYVPDFAMMKAGELSEFLSNELRSISSYVVMIKTMIKIVDLAITGIFFFIPDYDALQDLFKILGIEEDKMQESEDKKKK